MTDLLLPRTDAAVGVQFVVVATLAALAVVALRRQPEWRVLVVGVALAAFGAMAIRALH